MHDYRLRPLQMTRQPLTEEEAAEAAAVLNLLLTTSEQVDDEEALHYVLSTAAQLGVSSCSSYCIHGTLPHNAFKRRT